MSHRVISFHYTLTNPSGEKLDSSNGGEPLTYMEGVGQIIPGLESALRALKVGDKKRFEIKAEQAYGPKDPKRVVEIPIGKFPTKNVKIGDMFRANKEPNSPPLTVTKVSPTHVTLDANHPLAGVDLTFDVEVTTIRDATAEEIAHGHAHGADGHHHH